MVQTYFTIVHWTNNGKIVPFFVIKWPKSITLATSYSYSDWWRLCHSDKLVFNQISSFLYSVVLFLYKNSSKYPYKTDTKTCPNFCPNTCPKTRPNTRPKTFKIKTFHTLFKLKCKSQKNLKYNFSYFIMNNLL